MTKEIEEALKIADSDGYGFLRPTLWKALRTLAAAYRAEKAKADDLKSSVEEGVGYVHDSMRMVIELAKDLPDTTDRTKMAELAQNVIDSYRYIPPDHPEAAEARQYTETRESENLRLRNRVAELEAALSASPARAVE